MLGHALKLCNHRTVCILRYWFLSADPFLNDETYVLCVVTLEELGATGNKGLIGLMTNPVLANGLAGLATSATAQATVEVSPPSCLNLRLRKSLCLPTCFFTIQPLCNVLP